MDLLIRKFYFLRHINSIYLLSRFDALQRETILNFRFILYETFSFSSLSFIQIELPLPLMNTVTQYFQNLQSNAFIKKHKN